MSLTNPPSSSGSISARAKTVGQNLKRSLQATVDGNYYTFLGSWSHLFLLPLLNVTCARSVLHRPC